MRDFLLTVFMILGCAIVVCNDTCSDLRKVANMLFFIVTVIMWVKYSRNGKKLLKSMF